MLEEGKRVPAFTLTDADGRKVSLADLAGREVVLYFYPRDNTSGCTKEACAFRDLQRRFAARGVEVIGVSPDSATSHQAFATKHRLPFRLLSDPDKTAMRAFGAFGPKVSYGKKTTGVIRSTVWIGADGKVRKHWAKVAKAAEHPAAVLAEIEKGG